MPMWYFWDGWGPKSMGFQLPCIDISKPESLEAPYRERMQWTCKIMLDPPSADPTVVASTPSRMSCSVETLNATIGPYALDCLGKQNTIQTFFLILTESLSGTPSIGFGFLKPCRILFFEYARAMACPFKSVILSVSCFSWNACPGMLVVFLQTANWGNKQNGKYQQVKKRAEGGSKQSRAKAQKQKT